MPNNFQTREEWQNFIITESRPHFLLAGYPLPAKIRCATGFTSHGYRGKAIGECWNSSASDDESFEILVKPDQDDPIRVAGIIVHELCHVADNHKNGHKLPFKRIAHAVGLTEGSMKSVLDGEGFREWMTPVLKRAGPFPHKRLRASVVSKKKQPTRLLKCECGECGYIARVTSKWIDSTGAPYCGEPDHGPMQVDDGVTDGDDE